MPRNCRTLAVCVPCTTPVSTVTRSSSTSLVQAKHDIAIATGGAPANVVLAADNATAYVSNRADGTVVRVSGIDGGTPAVDATVMVGAEPVGLALSPTGKLLFVAEYAESRVSVIDTGTMQ